MHINLFNRTGIKRMVVLLGFSSLALITAATPMSSSKIPDIAKPVTILKGQAPRLVTQTLTTSTTLMTETGEVGNLQSSLINLAAQSDKSKQEDLKHKLLGKAKSLMGVPYRFGSNNPDKALDCSAYVQLIFHQVGIELPRSTFGQIKMGKPVGYSELKPGDLVFFSSDGPGPTHVGIYLGNGQMINETPPKVEIDTIVKADGSKTFYGRTYYSARRVLPEY